MRLVAISCIIWSGLGQTPAAAKPASKVPKPCTATALVAYSDEQTKEIVKTAEAIRSLDKAEIRVDLKNEASGLVTLYDMKILRSTEQRAYIEFLAPQEERGRRMLAHGKSYWSTFPDSKRVVPISRREMIGNSAFAIADVFQLDAERDYKARIVAEEKRQRAAVLKVDLHAKHADAPYACIEYWVTKAASFPLQARFYGISGKHLKTMTIETTAEIGGRIRPETTKMVDEAVQGHNSWWRTKSMTAASIPDAVFSTEYLGQQQ